MLVADLVTAVIAALLLFGYVELRKTDKWVRR
jgi:hypothetical protein